MVSFALAALCVVGGAVLLAGNVLLHRDIVAARGDVSDVYTFIKSSEAAAGALADDVKRTAGDMSAFLGSLPWPNVTVPQEVRALRRSPAARPGCALMLAAARGGRPASREADR